MCRPPPTIFAMISNDIAARFFFCLLKCYASYEQWCSSDIFSGGGGIWEFMRACAYQAPSGYTPAYETQICEHSEDRTLETVENEK